MKPTFWNEFLTPDRYSMCLQLAERFIQKHLDGLTPEDVEDLAHEALVSLFSRNVNDSATAYTILNGFYFRCLCSALRQSSFEPLNRAKGLRNHTHRKGDLVQQQEIHDQTLGTHDPDFVQKISENKALLLIDDLIRKRHPKAAVRYQRILRYHFLGLSRKEMAELERVSSNRIASLCAVLKNTVRSSYLLGEMGPILEVFDIPPPKKEDRIDKPLGCKNL